MQINKLKTIQKKYNLLLDLSKLSGVSTLELLMLVLDYKPAVADAINYTIELKKSMSRIKYLAQKFDLFFATSKYKYIVNSPQGIFEEIYLDDPRLGKIILSFSKSKDKSQKGADYYHAKMVDGKYGYKFGKLMGYPECCLQFGNYLQNLNSDPNNFGFKNPAVESLKRSKHFDWRLNVFTLSPIPHYPCSLTCTNSIAYVDKLFTALDFISPEQSSFLKDYLIRPASLYWTCADRVLLYGNFKIYTLGTGEIKYNEIKSFITSDVFYQQVNKERLYQLKDIAQKLSQGNKLIVTDKMLKIYYNKEKIWEMKKNNKYIPVLVKP
ncbi:MAG: hypothetical protein QXD43_01050, partial [Candidatus Aenigmatarchaeota archaeon]